MSDYDYRGKRADYRDPATFYKLAEASFKASAKALREAKARAEALHEQMSEEGGFKQERDNLWRCVEGCERALKEIEKADGAMYQAVH